MKTPTRHSGTPAATRRSQVSAIILAGLGADLAPSISQSLILLSSATSTLAYLAAVPEDYLLRFLGSHRWIVERLAARGHALEPLHFPAAIYHLGHGEHHTARSGILRVRPCELTAALRTEFSLADVNRPAVRVAAP